MHTSLTLGKELWKQLIDWNSEFHIEGQSWYYKEEFLRVVVPKYRDKERMRIDLDLSSRAQCRGLLGASHDGKNVAGGVGARIGQPPSSRQQQELEQQPSLGEWLRKSLKEFALQGVVGRGGIGAVQVPSPSGVADVLQIEVNALLPILGHSYAPGPLPPGSCGRAHARRGDGEFATVEAAAAETMNMGSCGRCGCSSERSHCHGVLINQMDVFLH